MVLAGVVAAALAVMMAKARGAQTVAVVGNIIVDPRRVHWPTQLAELRPDSIVIVSAIIGATTPACVPGGGNNSRRLRRPSLNGRDSSSSTSTSPRLVTAVPSY